MIIKGNFMESLSPTDLRCQKGYLTLDGQGRIVGFSKETPDLEGEILLDYGNKLILQGFCDIHLHAPQYPMRGIGLGLTLLDWLNTYTFPTESKFQDVNFARTIYRQLAKELISMGTTRVVAFSSLHTDGTLVLMEELERAGITGFVGKVNMDRNGGENYQETTEESIVETKRWLSSVVTTGILPIVTPRFIPCCTDELMIWLGELVKETGLAMQSHLSENDREIAWVRELHPDCDQYWQSYEKFGLWNDKTIMAHCVYSDEKERAAMKQAGVLVAHCPDSNINLTSGIAPVRAMLEEGVRVGLGSDISGGDQLSMLRIMRSVIQSSKMRYHMTGEMPLTVREVYYMATSASQPFFGAKPGFGIGDFFHGIVFDDSRFPVSRQLSLEERLERLIYLGEKEDISAIFANGHKIL